MNPALVAELTRLLKAPSACRTALEHRLRELPEPPPLSELLELAARARRSQASEEELALAIGALVALHAPRAGAFEH